jgi:peptidoglycan-N-acetylglucosamine deacetylase
MPRELKAPNGAGAVALTLDDGPSDWTEPILEVLARHGAKATFFLVGSLADRRADIVRRIADEGHEVGNHTWSHPRLARDCDDERVLTELGRTNATLEAILGSAPRRFRAPYYDVDDRVEYLAGTVGLVHTPGTVVPPDWHPANRSAFIATIVLQRAAPGEIVGLHDGIPLVDGVVSSPSRSETVKAVAEFVPRLLERGYEWVTASDLLDSSSP